MHAVYIRTSTCTSTCTCTYTAELHAYSALVSSLLGRQCGTVVFEDGQVGYFGAPRVASC